MRLIDADNLERNIMSMPDDDIDEDSCYNVINVIDREPTIDAVPVVHGEWVKEPMTFEKFYNDPYVSANCSICGTRSRERGNYCHNCGAKMKGEQE